MLKVMRLKVKLLVIMEENQFLGVMEFLAAVELLVVVLAAI